MANRKFVYLGTGCFVIVAVVFVYLNSHPIYGGEPVELTAARGSTSTLTSSQSTPQIDKSSSVYLDDILQRAHIGDAAGSPDVRVLHEQGAVLLIQSAQQQGYSVYATIDKQTETATSFVPYGTYAQELPDSSFLFIEDHRISVFRPGWEKIYELPGMDLADDEGLDAFSGERIVRPQLTSNPDGSSTISIFKEGYQGPFRSFVVKLPNGENGLKVSSQSPPEIGPE